MVRYLAAALLVSATILGSTWAWGQSSNATPPKDGQSTQGKDLPRLPETEVVGQPPGAAPEGNGGGEGVGTGQGNGNGSGNAPGQGGSILQGGIFSSPKAQGYNAESSTAGSLIDVPNLDIPGSIDVVPEQLRQDQQAIVIDDLLRDIGGAVKSGNQQYPDAFFLRGFEITSRNYRRMVFSIRARRRAISATWSGLKSSKAPPRCSTAAGSPQA